MCRRKSAHVVVSILLLFASGCASVRPEADYERARVRTAETTAVDSAAIATAFDEREQLIASHLDGGVSREEAVTIALLNNKDLQAAFYEIGIFRADVVQSGLLSNPSLGAVIRFPESGANDEATIEARLAWNLIDLWHRPARKRVRERQLERKVLDVAHLAAQLASTTRVAYVAAIAAERARRVEEENLDSTSEFLELILARQEAGAATAVEAIGARAEHLEQATRVRSASLREFEEKLRLETLLGLDDGSTELTLTSSLAPSLEVHLDIDALIDSVGSHRLDLRAAEENIRAVESDVSLQKRLFFREINGLISLESRGDELEVGPGLSMELPLFDQNRAQVARAELRYQQAKTSLDALTLATRQQIRAAHARLVTTLETAHAYRDEIAPLRESSLELALESFRSGKTGFLSVLEAQKRLLAARRDTNAWAEASALMVIELEAACGRPLGELFENFDSQ